MTEGGKIKSSVVVCVLKMHRFIFFAVHILTLPSVEMFN